MHFIALVVMVFFTHSVGVSREPISQVLAAPPGATIEDCKAHGQALIDTLRSKEGVADAEFSCVDFVIKAAI